MSAFVMGDKNFIVLANAAIIYEVYYPEPRRIISHEDGQALVDMLHTENVRSVCHRYPQDSADRYACPTFRPAPVCFRPDPVIILKLCDCYDYQSCETDDYEQSLAHKLISSIRKRAISNLPGYDKAPWGLD